MDARKLETRLLVTIATSAIIITIAYYACPAPPKPMTLGTLADKQPGQATGNVRVTNCVGGKQYGRFLVFAGQHPTRHTVVFALDSDLPLSKNRTNLIGYCEGICNFEIPGCPQLPPFLLITNAMPVP